MNFMTKELSKAIKHRSKLRNLYLQVNAMRINLGIRKKEIFVSHYLEKLKNHYEDLSIADVNDNKFWKSVKNLFGN